MKEIVAHKSMIFFGAQGETFKEMFQAWKKLLQSGFGPLRSGFNETADTTWAIVK